MTKQLRVWWPKRPHIQLNPPRSSCYVLFGWLISSSPASHDVVVADQASASELSPGRLEDILCQTNAELPVALLEKSMMSILGHCRADFGSAASKVGKKSKHNLSACLPDGNKINSSSRSKQEWDCGCDKMMETCGITPGSIMWIQLEHNYSEMFVKKKFWVPEVHHIHWDGLVVFPSDVHVILYDVPSYGSHYFSLSYSHDCSQVKTPLKKPNWVNELQLRRPLIDLDAVILAINCSATLSRLHLKKESATEKSLLRFSIIWMSYAFMWHALAFFVATVSTLFYTIIQFFHGCGNLGLISWIGITSRKAFNTTWVNIKIKSCQILYWSIFLQESGRRSHSCVEYEEKAALRKHSMWSNLAVDILLGNLIGLALLCYVKSTCSWVLDFGSDVSNLLRIGCVWLMGVPAGFKLNTEVTAILGLISLNVIQIWSTLCIFMGFILSYFIRGLAMLGIFFGATVLSALIKDMIAIASLHVSTLHQLISLVYSIQTKALAALWRLFRGQKWNPLRLRFDSYDYTVKQHIVGSLLFTPLLLLLPTTSVFYIFFTIMSSSISILCIMTEALISLIHATPYVKIFLWLASPKRFPAGIWLQIESYKPSKIQSAEGNSFPKDRRLRCKDSLGIAGAKNFRDGTNNLVSFLHSNFPSIGQIILPHYKVLAGGLKPLVMESARGILTGKRIPQTLETRLPSTYPWMSIPIKAYWQLCHDSVLSCMARRDDFSPAQFRHT